MSTKFYTLLTDIGAAKLANAGRKADSIGK